MMQVEAEQIVSHSDLRAKPAGDEIKVVIQ